MSDEQVTCTFTVNGESVTHTARAKRSILDVFREDFGFVAAKTGCSPQAICGCCTMIIGGKAKVTCTLPFRALEGKEVQTLEGFLEEERALLAEAFVRTGGSQCGYCTPGIAVTTKALLDAQPDPDEAAMTKALQMHICRCTGWVKILDAMKLAGAMKRGEVPVTQASLAADQDPVGADLGRNEGHALVLGDRPYIDDMTRPGMLHGALVWSPHPRCKVIKIDASKALALDGVVEVATAADFPGDRRVGLIFRDWPVMIGEGEETRCTADVLCAVAATSRDLAYRAAALIEVEVEELEPMTDLMTAAEDPGRVLATSCVKKGDVDEALGGEGLFVFSDRFEVQRIDQAFLEPEASLVVPRADGVLHIYSCGQGVFDDRAQLLDLFGRTEDELIVELVTTGGAFGAKEDLNVQPHAAILALKTGRPVKVSLTMEESTNFHPKRHPMVMDYTLAADAEGNFVAMKARIWGDTGGYASVGDKVLERAAGHATGPYRIAHVDVEARTVYTNNPICGAMRGFGVNQVAFALEGCIDRLAAELGRDPFELRVQNALKAGDTWGTGQLMDEGCGIGATLEAARPHYERARAEGKHVGVACALKNTGMGNGLKEVGRIELHVVGPSEIVIKTGFTEMGQGHNTVLRQMAHEATGLPSETFLVETDTSVMVETGMTTASRGTYLGGNGVIEAARPLAEALNAVEGDLGALVGQVFRGEWWAPDTHKPGDDPVAHPVTHYAFGWATQLAIVDGDGALEEVVAVHDVGRAINRVSCEGQVEGGVHMGIGYALSEDLVSTDGVPDVRFRNLGIIKARHMPKVTTVLVEVPDPHGPWGAKGVGEIGLVPTAPAIAGAMRGFDGTWRTKLPMKDSPAAWSVGVKKPRKRR